MLEIARSFIAEYARSFRKPVRGLDDQAQQVLLRYSFPGNVRELRNIIEQAVILARGELITSDLLSVSRRAVEPEARAGSSQGEALSLEALGDEPLVAAERSLIAQAMKKSGGNKKRAAEMLGISRFALQRRLEKLVMDAISKED